MPWKGKKSVARHNKKCAQHTECIKLWLETANDSYRKTGDDGNAVIRANVKAKNWLKRRGKYRRNGDEELRRLERQYSVEPSTHLQKKIDALRTRLGLPTINLYYSDNETREKFYVIHTKLVGFAPYFDPTDTVRATIKSFITDVSSDLQNSDHYRIYHGLFYRDMFPLGYHTFKSMPTLDQLLQAHNQIIEVYKQLKRSDIYRQLYILDKEWVFEENYRRNSDVDLRQLERQYSVEPSKELRDKINAIRERLQLSLIPRRHQIPGVNSDALATTLLNGNMILSYSVFPGRIEHLLSDPNGPRHIEYHVGSHEIENLTDDLTLKAHQQVVNTIIREGVSNFLGYAGLVRRSTHWKLDTKHKIRKYRRNSDEQLQRLERQYNIEPTDELRDRINAMRERADLELIPIVYGPRSIQTKLRDNTVIHSFNYAGECRFTEFHPSIPYASHPPRDRPVCWVVEHQVKFSNSKEHSYNYQTVGYHTIHSGTNIPPNLFQPPPLPDIYTEKMQTLFLKAHQEIVSITKNREFETFATKNILFPYRERWKHITPFSNYRRNSDKELRKLERQYSADPSAELRARINNLRRKMDVFPLIPTQIDTTEYWEWKDVDSFLSNENLFINSYFKSQLIEVTERLESRGLRPSFLGLQEVALDDLVLPLNLSGDLTKYKWVIFHYLHKSPIRHPKSAYRLRIPSPLYYGYVGYNFKPTKQLLLENHRKTLQAIILKGINSFPNGEDWTSLI